MDLSIADFIMIGLTISASIIGVLLVRIRHSIQKDKEETKAWFFTAETSSNFNSGRIIQIPDEAASITTVSNSKEDRIRVLNQVAHRTGIPVSWLIHLVENPDCGCTFSQIGVHVYCPTWTDQNGYKREWPM